MMTCNLCGKRVAQKWESKWKHLVKYHPEMVALKMIPMVFGLADVARSAGEVFARAARLPKVE